MGVAAARDDTEWLALLDCASMTCMRQHVQQAGTHTNAMLSNADELAAMRRRRATCRSPWSCTLPERRQSGLLHGQSSHVKTVRWMYAHLVAVVLMNCLRQVDHHLLSVLQLAALLWIQALHMTSVGARPSDTSKCQALHWKA